MHHFIIATFLLSSLCCNEAIAQAVNQAARIPGPTKPVTRRTNPKEWNTFKPLNIHEVKQFSDKDKFMSIADGLEFVGVKWLDSDSGQVPDTTHVDGKIEKCSDKPADKRRFVFGQADFIAPDTEDIQDMIPAVKEAVEMGAKEGADEMMMRWNYDSKEWNYNYVVLSVTYTK